jgi:hypothetical protein
LKKDKLPKLRTEFLRRRNSCNKGNRADLS